MSSPVTGSIIASSNNSVVSATAISFQIRPDPHTPLFRQSPKLRLGRVATRVAPTCEAKLWATEARPAEGGPLMPDPRFKTHTEHMNMRQRPEIKELARNAASAAGVSLSEWVAAAIAEKAGRPDLAPAKLRQEVMNLKLGA